jgi:asparagine synthase (glutamine-hydrolysing)
VVALMCGVFGGAGTAPEDLGPLVRWNGRRGPDGTGVQQMSGAYLGICRLAIVDVAAPAAPHRCARGAIASVTNGEIYNAPELRAELEALGHRFATGVDTEVIPHAWAEWGREAVVRLRGMFGFVLWDVRRRAFVAGRDRLGIKPLYWTRTARGPLFSSSLRALAQATGRGLRPAALVELLYRQSIAAPRTAVEGVDAIPPATVVEVTPAGTTAWRYWTPRAAAPSGGPAAGEALDRLDALLDAACARQARSDRPSAVAVSGGVDSALLATARPSLAPRWVVLDGPDDRSEAEAASALGSAAGREVRRLPFPRDWRAAFDGWIAAAEQPPADGFNVHLLCGAVAPDTVVLHTGVGGDELFNGYPGLAALAAGTAAHALPTALLRATALFQPADLRDAAASLGVRIDDVVDEAEARVRDAAARAEAEDGAELLRVFLLSQYLAPCLLANADAFSMAHAVELRVPLLDEDVVELALALPAAAMFDGRDGKVPLRALLSRRGLPPAVARAGKRGFALPYDALARELPPPAAPLDAVAVRGGPGAAGYRRFVLSAVSSWLAHVERRPTR